MVAFCQNQTNLSGYNHLTMTSFQLNGRVTEKDTGVPLSQLLVKAYSNGKFPGKLPGSVQTGNNGEFSIPVQVNSFREFFERRPDIFFSLTRPGSTKPFYTSEFAWNWKEDTDINIEVPSEKLAPARNTRLQLTDEQDVPAESFVPGSSVYITAAGLRPIRTYQLTVTAGDQTLFKSDVITNRLGNIESFNLWPQAGLSDPRDTKIFTFPEAMEVWRDVKLAVILTDGRKRLSTSVFTLSQKPAAPVVYHSDAEGRMLNGFVADKKSRIILSIYHYQQTGDARVYIVPSRQSWQAGDFFTPVNYTNGRTAVHDVPLRKGEQLQQIQLGASTGLLPGAYDFIIRPLRYGYEDDRHFRLLPQDIAIGNRITGLVIREEFMHGKLVQGGCVNKLDVSGRGINGQPYFQYADTFEMGEDVYFALDPNIVDPGNAGKMCAVYVVPNKSEPMWNAPGGNALSHLAVLGGNAAVQKFLVQTYCVNANKRLLWPAASQAGNYDIVADFGNNSINAATFVNDNAYDAPLDIIDGYFATGFRVVEDPTTITSFTFFGQFDYTQPAVTIQDEGNFFAVDSEKLVVNTPNVPIQGRVMFPADAAGATTAAQISASKPDYPMIFIVHGAGHHFNNYDYLLQHWAQNGFIAVAFEMPFFGGLGRANMLFQHINIIKAQFGVKAQNNIGIMGHSRGGEGVVKAARLNQQQALGHNINAVISLAPTDQYGNEVLGGAWAKPYLALHGSVDGDVRIFVPPVTGGAITPFTHRSGGSSLYDRANGAPKTMVFIYGASHNGFIGTNDLGLSGIDAASLITPAAQQTIAKGYMNAFFRKYLHGETKWDGIFTGEWKPQATTQANVKLYVQYSANNQLTIDHFEGAHTATSWQTGVGGVTLAQTGLVTNPQEAYLHDADTHSAHDTSGLLLQWNSIGDKLEFNVPAAIKNVSAWAMLSFRVCQRALDAANPANQPVNFRVALRDGSGNERAIRVSAFAEIPYPQQRTSPDNIISMFRTVRIPLTSYTIVCLGVPKVNLTDITKITFLFSEQASGSIELDDLCFTI